MLTLEISGHLQWLKRQASKYQMLHAYLMTLLLGVAVQQLTSYIFLPFFMGCRMFQVSKLAFA